MRTFDHEYLAGFQARRSLEKLRDWIESGCHYFVAADDGVPMGYLCVRRGPSTPESLNRFFGLTEADGFVVDVYIDSRYRGRGCYMQLVREMARTLREEGCERVWATFNQNNRAAISSASRVGFQTLGYCVRWRLGRRSGYWLITKSRHGWWGLTTKPLPSLVEGGPVRRWHRG